MRKKFIVFLVVFALIATAAPALANNPTADEIVPDLLFVRPVSFASIFVDAALFIVSLPVAIPSGSVGQVWQHLLVDPTKFTFVRPIGDFENKPGTHMRETGEAQ